jgi:hypothetical protein
MSCCLFRSFLSWILLSSRKYHTVYCASIFREEKNLRRNQHVPERCYSSTNIHGVTVIFRVTAVITSDLAELTVLESFNVQADESLSLQCIPAITFRNCAVCPYSVLLCPVWYSQGLHSSVGHSILVEQLGFDSRQRTFLLHSFQTGSGFHPASHPMCTGALFAGIKRPMLEADHSPPSSADVRAAP